MKQLLTFTLLTLLTVGIASAQQPILTFTAQSPFSLGNTNLPAGTDPL